MATTTRRPSGPTLPAARYRSDSPTRIKLAGRNAQRSVSVSSSSSVVGVRSRRSCMCSPTNHPGSFRCSLHKERKAHVDHRKPTSPPSPGTPTSSRLGAAASGRMGSALARIGAVEGGEWARRALAATVRPSPAAQHRRRVAGLFRPRPSRLSVMSVAGDRAGDNNDQ